jgi:hypothetical protein
MPPLEARLVTGGMGELRPVILLRGALLRVSRRRSWPGWVSSRALSRPIVSVAGTIVFLGRAGLEQGEPMERRQSAAGGPLIGSTAPAGVLSSSRAAGSVT